MNQYCNNCGTRLNGEAFCPKCQKPVAQAASDNPAQQTPHDPRPKPKWSKWQKICATIGCSLFGLLVLVGILLYIREERQRRHELEQWEEIARAERMDASENLARAKEGDPFHQYAFGNKKSKNATTAHEMDVAAQYLLAAYKGAPATGNPKLRKEVYGALVMWKCRAMERNLKPSCWQLVEDTLEKKRNAEE